MAGSPQESAGLYSKQIPGHTRVKKNARAVLRLGQEQETAMTIAANNTQTQAQNQTQAGADLNNLDPKAREYVIQVLNEDRQQRIRASREPGQALPPTRGVKEIVAEYEAEQAAQNATSTGLDKIPHEPPADARSINSIWAGPMRLTPHGDLVSRGSNVIFMEAVVRGRPSAFKFGSPATDNVVPISRKAEAKAEAG